MKVSKPTIISLFAGAGGMDLGFVRTGFNVVWANDNFDDAVETYKKNIGHEIECCDIEAVDISSIPDADVVIGGFPCQGFSIANMNRKIEDERNSLYKHFVKVVQAKRPKFFVAENVKGILSIGKGEVIKQIVKDFSDVGYQVRYELFNTANYGVPQSRQRVIILGIRKDVECSIEFPPPATHASQPIGNLQKHVSIGEALEHIPSPEEKHELKNHVYTKYKPKFNGYISNRKVDPDKPSPTVTARGDGKGGAMIINHPHEMRRLSCRELATVQGFPLDFEFVGSMTSVYRQIGNAVPPPFAEVIARTLYEAFKKGIKAGHKETETAELELVAQQSALFV